ncbi:MAG: hydroxyisourate hydrolase [Myxococcota bacterium]
MSDRGSISTHVLDLVRGGPAQAVPVRLERQDGEGWALVTEGRTDGDGRIGGLVPKGEAVAGTYRIRFDTGAWFQATGTVGFYPYVEVVFVVAAGGGHYHVPLLLGPYGYSTYRGS